MKTAIIIHGKPSEEEYYNPEIASPSNFHWLPRLQKQLLINNICAQTPEMPTPYNPEYTAWKKIFERSPLDKHTILVGHSCGAGFIIRYLSENDIEVGKVILVAPWIDPLQKLETGMFDFTINKNTINKTKEFILFESTNDSEMVQQSITIIKQQISGLKVRTFKDYGHFCIKNLQTEAFPELLESCLS